MIPDQPDTTRLSTPFPAHQCLGEELEILRDIHASPPPIGILAGQINKKENMSAHGQSDGRESFWTGLVLIGLGSLGIPAGFGVLLPTWIGAGCILLGFCALLDSRKGTHDQLLQSRPTFVSGIRRVVIGLLVLEATTFGFFAFYLGPRLGALLGGSGQASTLHNIAAVAAATGALGAAFVIFTGFRLLIRSRTEAGPTAQ
jgi:hypothetical protein